MTRVFRFPDPATSTAAISDDEGDVINLLHTSLVFNDQDADQDAYFTELIHDAAANGKRIFCHRDKTLWLGQVSALPEGNVFFDFAPNFVIKGIPAFAGTILTIDGVSVRPRFYARNLSIDNSLRPFVTNEASGTGLTLRRLTDFELFNYRWTGAADLSTAPVSGFGDSGISINQCNRGRLWAPKITSQPDLGIYVTGGPSTAPTDDYGDIEIHAPFISDCAGAISNKRQGRRVTVIAGTVLRCRTGISGATASSVGPGRELSVIGTQFKRVTSRAILAQGECNLTVVGAEIEDWGYNPVTDAIEVGEDMAIQVEGPSYATIDASFKLRDWVDNGTLQAVRLVNFTENAVTYTPVGCRVTATIENIQHGIEEVSAGITGNSYDLMLDSAVTTDPVLWASGSASQLIENTTAGQRAERRAGTVFDLDRMGTVGGVINIRQDNVSQGLIQTTSAGYAVFQGAPRLPTYTAATLPVVANDAIVIYVSDGDAGSPCLAVSRSGAWRRIPLGAAI